MVCSSVVPLLWCGEGLTPCFEASECRLKHSPIERPTAVVIDDERLIADTIAQILRLSGFDALSVYSGKGALEQIATGCPDVVITDVVMPELNGIETAKMLLASCPATKILLLSGQAETGEMIKKARDEGYDFQLLAKPLHPDELLGVLRRLGF